MCAQVDTLNFKLLLFSVLFTSFSLLPLSPCQVHWKGRLNHHQCMEPQEDPQKAGRRFPGLCPSPVQRHQQTQRHWL